MARHGVECILAEYMAMVVRQKQTGNAEQDKQTFGSVILYDVAFVSHDFR